MKTYVTPDFSDVTQAIIDDCSNTSFAKLRHTVSGTDKVFLDYEGDDPSWVASLGLTKYTHSGAKTEAAKDEWNGASDD